VKVDVVFDEIVEKNTFKGKRKSGRAKIPPIEKYEPDCD